MISRKLIVLAAASVAVNGLVLAEGMDKGSSIPGQGSSMQGSPMQNPMQQQQLTPQKFVNHAASGSQFEIQSAKLAEKTSDDPEVKRIAKGILRDHEAAAKDLDKAARKSGLTVSQKLQPQDQQMLDGLKDKTGKDFDQAYLQDQVQAHQKSVALYQQAANQLQDQNLKDHAQKTLPKLQEHQAMVQDHQRTASPSQAQPAGSRIQSDQDQQYQDKHSTQQPPNRVPARQGEVPSDQNQDQTDR